MTDSAPLDAETTLDPGASGDPAASPHPAAAQDPVTAGTVLAPTGRDAAGRPWPPFAHGSETEMARILDFYGVRWEYEPRTFPILWNLDGEVVESFSPDFYLPDLDLFLELTTLKQRLVRKKNRKLRRLRELYPALRIKLFYARDFRAMMLKYGRLALADSMSGTLGQVVPERGRYPDLEPATAADDVAVTAAEAAAATAADATVAGSMADDPLPGRPRPAEDDALALARAAAEPRALPVARDPALARPGPGLEPSSRRNASRSRRRRAAAAARAAARATADIPARSTNGQRQEDSARR